MQEYKNLSLVFLTGYSGGFPRSPTVHVEVPGRKKNSSSDVAEPFVKPPRRFFIIFRTLGNKKIKMTSLLSGNLIVYMGIRHIPSEIMR